MKKRQLSPYIIRCRAQALRAKRELDLLRAGKSTDEFHFTPLLCTRKDWQKPIPVDESKPHEEAAVSQTLES